MTDQESESNKLSICSTSVPNPEALDEAKELSQFPLVVSTSVGPAELESPRPGGLNHDCRTFKSTVADFTFSGRNWPLLSLPIPDYVPKEIQVLPADRNLLSFPFSKHQAKILGRFPTKVKCPARNYRFRSSLAPIGEVIYQDIGVFITQSNKNRRLCEYVFRNEYNFVKTLLSLGISPNCLDEHKRTPLHIAVSKGYCEMVQLLLDNGADPNAKDGLGNSCLHLAACTNNVEMALILIRGGASVHAVDIRGRSPIQLAQSKLKILQQCPDGFIKSKVEQVIDMLLLYLQKGPVNREKTEETELLSGFQNRLQITESPQQISNEIDNLSKILNQMQTLTIK